MPRFRVPTDAGTFDVETDTEDPTEGELLALVSGEPAPEPEPGLLRRGAALAARVGLPVLGGVAGLAAGGPTILGAPAAVYGGAVAGGAAGEALAETILGEPLSPTEIGLSGALAAVPAGPFARAAARPGLTLAKRALLTAAEGASQGVLAAEAESVVHEGELAGPAEIATGAAGGAVVGGALGVVFGRRSVRGERSAERVPVAPPSGIEPTKRFNLGPGQEATDVPAALRGSTMEHAILDEAGAEIGKVLVTPLGEGGLHINDIYIGALPAERVTRLDLPIGAAGTRQLLRDLQGAYPGTTEISGLRVTGAQRGDALRRIKLRPQGIKQERATLTPEVPLAPQTASAEAAQEAQGSLFRRVPGLAGDVPPISPIPDSRLTELSDSVDRLFPHLGEVEKVALKSTIAEQGDELLYHSRSVQSVERTDALAQELVFDLAKPLPKGTALNAEQMRHVVNLVSPLQERVTALAGEVTARPGDDVLKLKLQHATTRLTNVLFAYSGARAEAGRTLNILRQQAKAMAVGDAKSILAARKLGIDADAIAKVIAASPDDPVSQYKQLRDMYRPDWKDKLKWYYYSNILSGPQTHARNLVSNVVNLSLRPATTPLAAAVDVAGAKFGAREREVFAGEAPIQFLQMYRALPEAWNKMAFMFRNGFSLSDVQDFEVRPAEMPGGVAVNVVGRSLAAADEFFRAIGFSMEMHAGAFARARKQARKEGLGGAELRDRTSALTAELLDRKPADLMEQADKFSRRVTFQEQDNAVARGLQAFRDAVPGGSFLVPFVRTPANIFRQGLHFSPAGFLMRGAGSGRVGQQRMGEAALGTMLLAPVAWLAATERITGAAPTDAGERDAFYAEGKRPNSIRIGDTWVSYAEAGPLVLPFAVVANAADAWRRSGGELSAETVGAIVGQVGRSTLEQSYLTSLSAVFQALEDPQRYGRAFIENLAAG
ncbi:MAG: hypothetical protein ACRDZ4_11005, partial [Egibacteraceae bacterium]